MKIWKYVILGVLLLFGIVAFVCIRRVKRLGREDLVYELLTEVSAFSANHNQRLPQNWSEFCEYTNPGRHNKWSSRWLDSFGVLRWGQTLGGKKSHEPYLRILSPNYLVFQSEADEYFWKYDHD